MGFFNLKEEKNEIMELKNTQAALEQKTNRNNSDIIAFELRYKEDMNKMCEQIKELANINKELIDSRIDLEKRITALENERKLILKQQNDEKVGKEKNSEMLTYKELVRELKINGLNETFLKYYFYDIGIMSIRIPSERTQFYTLQSDLLSKFEISKYIKVEGTAYLFSRDIVCVLLEKKNEIVDSINLHTRKLRKFKNAKKNLLVKEVKNYRNQINNILGIKNNFNSEKWTSVYDKYIEDHGSFWGDYNKYRDNEIKNGRCNKNEKPSVLSFLLQKQNAGYALLKIACELYVD